MDATVARGCDADAPSSIPVRGWREVLGRALRRAYEDRLLTEAAAVAFYALLALAPALAVLVSLYGLVADPATAPERLRAVVDTLPAGGAEVVEEWVGRLAARGRGNFGLRLAAGLGVALWSAGAAASALIGALNTAYGERERRGLLRLVAVSLLVALGGGAFVLLALAGMVALPVAVSAHPGGAAAAVPMLRLLRWPVLLVLVAVGLAALYRYGPSRAAAKWRWVSWGGALAAAAWLLGSAGISWYADRLHGYDRVYGSLGAVVGFLTWTWLSCAAVLLGAVVNAEAERQTARDTTAGPGAPPGERGARAADAVVLRGE